MKIFAASAGGLRPKDTRGHFFLPEEGGFGAFSVSSARGFLSGRSALKYKRENRNFLYQAFLFRFLEFCLEVRICTINHIPLWSTAHTCIFPNQLLDL